jgi:hypothetical protein
MIEIENQRKSEPMNKRLYPCVAVICALRAAFGQSLQPLPASITIHVVDEEGLPIEDASAGATFTGFDPAFARVVYIFQHLPTTKQGVVTATGDSLTGWVFYGAEKEGYYKTTGLEYEFSQKKDGRWQPWNPTVEVVLKRIVNPIPMFAKRVETKIPEDAMAVGFDLEASDWVAPYGKGSADDLLFTVKRTIKSDRDYKATLELGFSNKGDGLLPLRGVKGLGSELLLPRTAPETGYESGRTWISERAPNASGPDTFSKPSDVEAYFFRVRTVLDEKGKVITALYGKIDGDFGLYMGTKEPRAGLGFTYYLNPTPNDRNVEFNPKRNLFTDLKGMETVRTP